MMIRPERSCDNDIVVVKYSPEQVLLQRFEINYLFKLQLSTVKFNNKKENREKIYL